MIHSIWSLKLLLIMNAKLIQYYIDNGLIIRDNLIYNYSARDLKNGWATVDHHILKLIFSTYHLAGGSLTDMCYSTFEDSIDDCVRHIIGICCCDIAFLGLSFGAGGISITSSSSSTSSTFCSSYYIGSSCIFFYGKAWPSGLGALIARLDTLPEFSKSNTG